MIPYYTAPIKEAFWSVFTLLVSGIKVIKGEFAYMVPCAHPESFVRVGPTLTTFRTSLS